jgi:DNA-directed RNA polymerase specialized sigma24 family protein
MEEFHAKEVSVDEDIKELLKYMKALLSLQIQALGPFEDRAKPEVSLARAGLSAREIGDLLGKKPAAVAKAIQRGKEV